MEGASWRSDIMLKRMCRRPPCSHAALSTVHQRPASKTGVAPLAPNRNSALRFGDIMLNRPPIPMLPCEAIRVST